MLFRSWDRDGELLAVLQQGSAIIKLWDANQHSESSLDTNMKDLSFIKWAVAGPQLAIGTAKGNRKHRSPWSPASCGASPAVVATPCAGRVAPRRLL